MFLQRKAHYETQVRDPFLRLIADLVPGLGKINSHILVDPNIPKPSRDREGAVDIPKPSRDRQGAVISKRGFHFVRDLFLNDRSFTVAARFRSCTCREGFYLKSSFRISTVRARLSITPVGLSGGIGGKVQRGSGGENCAEAAPKRRSESHFIAYSSHTMIQTRMKGHAARLCLALLAVFPACAASLELRYDALERIVAEQLFTQEGRRYVRGTAATKCQFAYLEAPHVSAENGRLKVTARFSGRSALDVFGHCVGLGDSFDLTVTAAPIPKGGAVVLKDVKVTTIRNSYYIGRVRAALADSIAKGFKIEVNDQARRLIEQPVTEPSAIKPPVSEKPAPVAAGKSTTWTQGGTADKAPAAPVYQRELKDFQLSDVQVTPDALVLVVEFRLVVK